MINAQNKKHFNETKHKIEEFTFRGAYAFELELVTIFKILTENAETVNVLWKRRMLVIAGATYPPKKSWKQLQRLQTRSFYCRYQCESNKQGGHEFL